MASPSQAWRGNCADFPQAPTRRRTPTAGRTAAGDSVLFGVAAFDAAHRVGGELPQHLV